jgi:C4-dicarboxylate-specific signal transduction histidine kinase
LHKDEQSRNFEFRCKIGGADKVLNASVIKMGDELALVMLHDVTVERARQEKLYLADRLATVGEMASGIAHELNNPLTSVIALSRMLLDQGLQGDIQEDVTYIHSEAQRAALIVKNMLTFARKHAAIKQSTPVNKILEDVINIRSYEHKINNITVKTCLDPDLPEIKANYFQIQQVFLNIILNAENAVMELPGNNRLLSITTSRDGDCIRISFVDNGPGIPEENIDRVFDPFFTTKEVGKGTGLGLSICYGIVNSHGGRLKVTSQSEKGASFIVELPLVADAEPETFEAVFSVPDPAVGTAVEPG